MIDDTIVRDLQRIVNDRQITQRHRNVARRAVTILTDLQNGESYDPDKTDFRANFDTMKEREETQLRLLDVDL